MNTLRRTDEINSNQKESSLCNGCLEERIMRQFMVKQITEESAKISREKKEVSPQNLSLLEKMIGEALSKTSEIEKMKENVILALKSFDPCQFAWEKYYNFLEKGYTRNLVMENELFELLVICWDKECQTPIHDHPSDGCWMVGIEGTIIEEKFQRKTDETLTKFSHVVFGEREIAYIHDYLGLHSVGNNSKEQRAVTLHLYSPPIRKCFAYQENGLKIQRVLKYFSKNRGNDLA